MKKHLRFICFAMVALFCLSAVACAQSNDDTPADTTTSQAVADNTPEDTTTAAADETTAPTKLSSLPEDLDFEGATVNFLYWDDVERPEFFSEGMTGDNVNDAIYQRNLNVEDRLKVKLNYIGEKGNVSNSDNFLKKVQNSFNAGEKAYDILASHSRTGGVVAAGGMAMDLLDIDDSYIDLSMPWWPESITETATIGDKMYFISGDISTNTLHFMYGVYYNTDR